MAGLFEKKCAKHNFRTNVLVCTWTTNNKKKNNNKKTRQGFYSHFKIKECRLCTHGWLILVLARDKYINDALKNEIRM